MSGSSVTSRTFAAIFGILTIVVIGGLVGMLVLYKMELKVLDPTAPPTAPVTTLAPPPEMRLRGDVLPESYEVFIKVHFYSRFIEEVNVTTPNQTLYFNGNVTVHLHCVEKTQSIFLHSRRQNVSKPVVTDRNSKKRLEVKHYILHEDASDFLEIVLGEPLEVRGNYSLFMAFSADVNEYLEGLFLSTYQEGAPETEDDPYTKRYLVATNLEPTSARTVFPCFDEPAMKARFTLTVIHREETIALANEDKADSNLIGDGWQYTSFHPTQPMSTYLFAFTVSEFTPKKTPHLDRKIYTYARSEATDAGHTDFAASITGDILDYYQDYFDISYTQKLDQIALPDLGPAAMENWGLVTYQEGALLYEKGVSSPLQKEAIASLIAHELAHQWFGNMVTMKWWNQVWLNEGFATYMSTLAVDHVMSSELRDLVVSRDLHVAFEADALASSHPLTPPAAEILTTDQILELFDTITYSKGSMVLRMLADVLGGRVFHQGIRIYLSSHKLGTTDQYDLWAAMEKAQSESFSHIDIVKVMDTWTNQIGYPVITINTSSGEAYQKQFLFNHTSESDSLWQIPVRVESSAGKESLEWIYTKKVTKEMFRSKKGEWILANVNCAGFYRVNYDLENWARLLNGLETNPENIPLLRRGQLIDDAFNLARAKQVSVTLALNSTRFLRSETEYIPWESAMRNLEYFIHMFDRTEVYGPMQVYLQDEVRELYDFFRTQTDNSTVPDDHSSQLSQIMAIKVGCSNGLPECVEMAKGFFHFWMTNGNNKIHTNLRSVIYCQAIAEGGQKEWEFAWNRLQSTTDLAEKDQLQEALTCTKKIWLLNRYLEYTLDQDKIRFMDASTIINSVARNEAGQALAWNFIRANWDYLGRLHGPFVIQAVTSRFSTPFELLELEYFAANYDLGFSSRVVQNAIEQTKVNIEWVNEHRDTVLDWFLAETS